MRGSRTTTAPRPDDAHSRRRRRLRVSASGAAPPSGPPEGASGHRQGRPADHRFSWQLNPEHHFVWCDLCGGSGFLECNWCNGRGKVFTEPGNAGAAFYVGVARCSECWGQRVSPCPLCAGTECKAWEDPADPLGGLARDLSNVEEWVEKTLANAGEYSNLGPFLGPELKRKKNEEAKKKAKKEDGGGDEG